MQAHLLLSLDVIREHKTAILQLSQHIRELEGQITSQGITLATLATANNTTVENLRSLDKSVQSAATNFAKVIWLINIATLLHYDHIIVLGG